MIDYQTRGRPRGYDTGKGLSYATIERIGLAARDRLGLPRSGPIDGLQVFERLDRVRVQAEGRTIPLSYAVKELPDGVDACAKYEPDEGEIVVYLAARCYDDLRRRKPYTSFVLCHEVMHAVLHHQLLERMSQMAHRKAVLQRGDVRHPPYRDTEWQADSGAAAMLAPATSLHSEVLRIGEAALSPDYISEMFGVTNTTATIRARHYKERLLPLLQQGKI